MNGKRVACLVLGLLLALPLAARADTEQRVRNDGTEAVGIYEAIGDAEPRWSLGPGQEVRYLGDWGNGWHQVQALNGSFVGFLLEMCLDFAHVGNGDNFDGGMFRDIPPSSANVVT